MRVLIGLFATLNCKLFSDGIDRVGAPGLDCETNEFCLMRSVVDGPWGIAKSICEQNNMVLPNPKTKAENDQYAAAGPTWIDINVNDVLSCKHYINLASCKYNCLAVQKETFWTRRQRGFLNTEGRWSVENGADNMPYYCVQSGYLEPTCDNIFTSDALSSSFENPTIGKWTKFVKDKFVRLHPSYRQDKKSIKIGEIFSYRCNNRMASKKNTFLMCGMMVDGDEKGQRTYGICSDSKCESPVLVTDNDLRTRFKC